MSYPDLRAFISALDKAGELKRISAEVDPVLEIAEVADRVVKHAGPALLFEHPRGYRGIPLLINQFGSRRRMAMALGVDHVDAVAARIRALLEMQPPEGLLGKLKMLPVLAEVGAFFPRTVKHGACQEVVLRDSFSVLDFPILQCWPADGGRYITFPLVFSRSPQTGRRNVGMYRLQVYDGQTIGMHWQIHKQGADHMREQSRRAVAERDAASDRAEKAVEDAAEEAIARAHGLPDVQAPMLDQLAAKTPGGGERMPVAVAIGTDPATTFAAILPAPPALDEMMLAGFLRQSPVEMVKCQTVDLEVPASAEIVLEGYVDLNERRLEGPFGDHTGFYSLADHYPVLHLTAITHRRQPIYSTTIVGKPPMEDGFMGEAVARIFLPLMQMQFPEIIDVNLPVEGVFHNLMIVAIRKSYPGHARKIMNGIWGLGQAMFTKCILIVDEGVDVQNIPEVVLHAFNHIDPERDIQFTLGPVDALDHASRLPGFGSKMGVDATRKWPSEGFQRPWPSEIRSDAATRARVDALWKKLGL